MREHTCHAFDCGKPVPRIKLFCEKHWEMTPREIRERIWETYQPGQEQGRVRPSPEYLHAAVDAKFTVQAAETGRLFHMFLRDLHRARAVEAVLDVLRAAGQVLRSGISDDEFARLTDAAAVRRMRIEGRPL
jgi:hypothetical protein